MAWTGMNFTYLKKWTIIGMIVGLLSGGMTIIFYISIQMISGFFLGSLAGYTPPAPGISLSQESTYALAIDRIWMIPLILSGVGIIAGVITTRLAPETKGDGIDSVIEGFHGNKVSIRRRVAIIKPIVSSLTLGAGASGGPEGPMGQISSAFGTIIGKLFRLDDEEIRIAIVSGMGAGIGSIMRLPFGGALFSIELLYGREFMIKSLIPVLVASLTSYAVSGVYLGWLPILSVPESTVAKVTIQSISAFAILSLVVGASSILYTRTISFVRTYFEKARIPQFVKPAFGCALVGLFALGLPEVLGTGYGWLQIAVFGNIELLPIWIIIAVVLVKIFATAITVGSGTGLSFFGPSLVIGGLLGAAVISIFHMYGLFMFVDISSATLVSMFAFFAAGTKTPFSSIVMGTEMTGGYFLLVPLVVSVLISYIVSGKNSSIFKNSISGFSIRNKKINKNLLLQQFRAGDAMDTNFFDVSKDAAITEAIQIMKDTNVNVLAVTDNEDQLEGVIYYRNLLEASEVNNPMTTVEHVMIKDPPCLLPSDTLQKSLETIVQSGCSQLFIVSPADRKLVEGIISLDAISKICDEKRPALVDIENINEPKFVNEKSFSPSWPPTDHNIKLAGKQFWAKFKDHWPIQ
jgi:CIC family chloride channel protein